MKFKKIVAAFAGAALTVSCFGGLSVFAADEISAVAYGTDAYTEKSEALTVSTSGHVLDNGQVAEFSAAALPEGGLSVTYPITVPEDGVYSVELSANNYDAGLSSYAIYVDDNEPVAVQAGNVLMSQPHPDGGNLARYMSVFQMDLEYTLTEGTHTVTVQITGTMGNGSVRAYFEYLKLIKDAGEDDDGPVEDIFVYGTSQYREKSDLLNVVTGSGNEVNNGRAVRLNANSLGDDGYLFITYPFEVKRAGSYTLTINSGRYDAGYLSKYAFSFDDGADIPMDASIVTNTADHPQTNDPGTHGFANMKVYTTNQILDLDKGMHTVTFKITSLREQGNVYQFLEYFQLEYIDEEAMVAEVEALIDSIGTVTLESKPAIDAARAAYDALLDYLKPNVSNYDVLTQAEHDYNRLLHAGSSSITIYGSDSYTSKTPDLNYSIATDPFTNGQVAALRYGQSTLPEGGLSVTYTFDVYNEGTYTLYLSSPKLSNIYMSPYAISVDGGAATDISTAVVEREDVHPDGGSYSEYLGRYKTTLKFDFAEGSHTVTFHVTGTRQNGDFWCYLEYIRFVLDEDIASIRFNEDMGYAEIGETYTAPLAAIGAVSGDEVDLAEAEVRYTSSDPAVATVDDAGIVTPIGFGSVTIRAQVSKGSFTGSAEMAVGVSADGIYCAPQGYFDSENGQLTALSQLENDLAARTAIFNNSEEEKTVTLVLALYKDGALAQYQTASYTVDAGESVDQAEVVLEGAAYEAGMSARLFLWGDASIPAPVGSAAELQ